MQYIESSDWMIFNKFKDGLYGERQRFNIDGVLYEFPLPIEWCEEKRCPLYGEPIERISITIHDFKYGPDYVFGKSQDLIFYKRSYSNNVDDVHYTLSQLKELLAKQVNCTGVLNKETRKWEMGA